MDKILKPDKLELCIQDKGDDTAETFIHWTKTIENFISVLGQQADTEEKST